MNKGAVFILGAILGAGAGAFASWKLLDEKYKKIADDEIKSVIDYYKNKYNKNHTENNDEIHTVKIESYKDDNKDENKYENLITDLKYSSEKESENDEDEEVEEDDNSDGYVGPKLENRIEPYLIEPEEYGYEDDYGIKSLLLYEDLILADEDDVIIVNPETIIGDALDHFDNYDGESVYVRNENTKCDYEILKSMKTYAEAVNGQIPYIEEDN